MQTVDQEFEQRYLYSLYNSSEFYDKLLTGVISHPPQIYEAGSQIPKRENNRLSSSKPLMAIQRG